MSSAWTRRRSHSASGKSLSHEAKPAIQWFLNVLMARSAAFLRCILGGVNSYCFLFFVSACFRSRLHSLSSRKFFVGWPWLVRRLCNSSHASAIVLACLFFRGVARIAFES